MKSSIPNNIWQGPVPWVLLLGLGLAGWEYAWGIPDWFQWAFFVVVVMVLGIPHGAIDHIVAAKGHREAARPFNLKGFYARYLLLLGLIAVGWFILPTLSLIAFLLVSALHFGETDLAELVPGGRWRMGLYLGYGSALLLILLIPNAEEVASVLTDLSPDFTQSFIAYLSAYGLLTALILGGLSLGTALVMATSGTARLQIGLLALLMALLWFLPLKISFAVYFGGVHSIHAYEDIRAYLSRNEDHWSRKQLIRAMLPLSLLAVPGTLLISYAGLHFLNPILLVFIFIASLTWPHVRVMRSIYRSSP